MLPDGLIAILAVFARDLNYRTLLKKIQWTFKTANLLACDFREATTNENKWPFRVERMIFIRGEHLQDFQKVADELGETRYTLVVVPPAECSPVGRARHYVETSTYNPGFILLSDPDLDAAFSNGNIRIILTPYDVAQQIEMALREADAVDGTMILFAGRPQPNRINNVYVCPYTFQKLEMGVCSPRGIMIIMANTVASGRFPKDATAHEDFYRVTMELALGGRPFRTSSMIVHYNQGVIAPHAPTAQALCKVADIPQSSFGDDGKKLPFHSFFHKVNKKFPLEKKMRTHPKSKYLAGNNTRLRRKPKP